MARRGRAQPLWNGFPGPVLSRLELAPHCWLSCRSVRGGGSASPPGAPSESGQCSRLAFPLASLLPVSVLGTGPALLSLHRALCCPACRHPQSSSFWNILQSTLQFLRLSQCGSPLPAVAQVSDCCGLSVAEAAGRARSAGVHRRAGPCLPEPWPSPGLPGTAAASARD